MMRKKEAALVVAEKKPLGQRFMRNLKKYWQYYILLLPALAYFLIFCYGPMYGAQIAFRDFIARDGITGSGWASPTSSGSSALPTLPGCCATPSSSAPTAW